MKNIMVDRGFAGVIKLLFMLFVCGGFLALAENKIYALLALGVCIWLLF